MSTALAIAPDGTLCIDKTGPADALEQEAAILRSLEITGVPTILDGPDRGRLRLLHAGRHTLATWTPPTPRDLAALIAAVADVADALHESGVVHGAIRPDHVVVAGNGAPVLVGFSAARRADDPAALSPAVPIRERREDIAGLAGLCELATGGARGPRGLGRLRRPRSGDDAALLDDVGKRLADGRFDTARGVAVALRHAFALSNSEGPTALVARRRLGAEIAHRGSSATPRRPVRQRGAHIAEHGAMTTPRRPRDHTGQDPRSARTTAPGSSSHARATTTTLGGVGATLVVVATGLGLALAVAGFRGPTAAVVDATEADMEPSADADHETTTGADPTTADTTTATDPTTADTTTGADPTTGTTDPAPGGCIHDDGPDVDGDGCPDAVRVEPGSVVVDGARHSVGEPGDTLVVGDWDCDGTATLGLIRPATGEVWMFRTWPGETAVVATLAAKVAPPAAATVTTSMANSCDRLVVRGDGEMWSSTAQ